MGFVKLAMGNTLGICSDVAWPTSNSPLKLKPNTKPIDFLKDFSNTPSNSNSNGNSNVNTVLPVNLNTLIGSKFGIAGVYINSAKNRNIKGE